MWIVFIVLIYLITMEVWKCGNVEICLQCLNLSNNSGSVEMWKYVFIVLIYLITLEVWKCGNLEICFQWLYVITLEVWKCGNVKICLQCLYLITLEVWKSGNVSGMIWELKIGLACSEMTCVTSDCCQSQDSHIASFSSPPGRIFQSY